MNWQTLLSGFLGAIIGALATIFASWFAIWKTAKIDFERRKQQEQELKSQILKLIVAEINDNLELSKETFISHAKTPFLNDAYQLYKLNASILPPDLLTSISPVYAEISKYNSLINYDQHLSMPVSIGTFDEKFVEKNKVIEEKLSFLINKVQKFLNG
jgi:hypothetical protein